MAGFEAHTQVWISEVCPLNLSKKGYTTMEYERIEVLDYYSVMIYGSMFRMPAQRALFARYTSAVPSLLPSWRKILGLLLFIKACNGLAADKCAKYMCKKSIGYSKSIALLLQLGMIKKVSGVVYVTDWGRNYLQEAIRLQNLELVKIKQRIEKEKQKKEALGPLP